jgi:hypothetical protein
METKFCSKCSIEKELNTENFAQYKSKWRSECRKCGNLMCKLYKQKNKEKIQNYNKTYKQENKDAISEYNKLYNIENREQIQKRQTEQHKIRRQTDISYRLAISIRNRMYKLMKRNHKSSMRELLGCSKEFFLKWLDFQDVDKKFTIENYGKWHLDHVIPCCSFNLEEEMDRKICFHWSNYRPLDGFENLSKNGKYNEDYIQMQKILANKFIEEIAKKNFQENDYTIL